MFHINVWLTANDETTIPRVRELLGQCVRGSRAEDGCVRFDAFQSEADPRRFLLVETWRSREDWDIHKTRETVTKIYVPQVLPLVTREPHISTLVE